MAYKGSGESVLLSTKKIGNREGIQKQPSEWSVVYEHPETGQRVTWSSPRPLRQDEVVDVSRHLFGGRDATVVHMDPKGGYNPQLARGAPTALPRIPESEGQQAARHQEAQEGLGFMASLVPPLAGPAALLKAIPAMRQLPRVAELAGRTAGGAVAPPVQAVVAGRPETALEPAPMATSGGLSAVGSLLGIGKGFASRQFRGAEQRVGDTMARELGEVAETQVPSMKGLTTGGHIEDWVAGRAGQRGLNEMYETAKQGLFKHFPTGFQQRDPTTGGLRWVETGNLGERTPVFVPAVSRFPIPFDKALDEIARLGRAFRSGSGSQASRKAHLAAKDQLIADLERRLGVPPRAIDDFLTMREQYAMGKGYQGLFKGSTEQRELSPQRLQEYLTAKPGETAPSGLEKLQTRFGESKDPEALNKVLDIVLRGKKDPATGGWATGQTDIPPAATLGDMIRYYFINTPQGITGRAGIAPRAGAFTKYLAAPGRLPQEATRTTHNNLALLSQLLRGKIQEPPATE